MSTRVQVRSDIICPLFSCF